MSYQVKKRRDECLCTFANPYSPAGCASVDLNLVYSASLISFSFFMASISLLMSFSFFESLLCVTFSLSMNCSACNNFSVSSHMSPF